VTIDDSIETMSLAKVGKRFDLSRSTLYRLKERGLKHHKIGGKVLIEVRQLRELIASGAITSRPT